MYICYIDESGTSEQGGTSHFVLGGVAVPADKWKQFDGEILCIKAKYGLEDTEIHTGWMLRRYIEQEKIKDFSTYDRSNRRDLVLKERNKFINIAAATKDRKKLYAICKNYKKTEPYIHMNLDERNNCISDICDEVGRWVDVRLFAESFDKDVLSSWPSTKPPLFEHAFTQVISRFQDFLENRGNYLNTRINGLIVQDNNETMAKRLTHVMRLNHKKGTFYTDFNRIVETPLFVDSSLTSMVQIADVCVYAIRRFFENNETALFDKIYSRFDRVKSTVVGIRHFVPPTKSCSCRVCIDHKRMALVP